MTIVFFLKNVKINKKKVYFMKFSASARVSYVEASSQPKIFEIEKRSQVKTVKFKYIYGKALYKHFVLKESVL